MHGVNKIRALVVGPVCPRLARLSGVKSTPSSTPSKCCHLPCASSDDDCIVAGDGGSSREPQPPVGLTFCVAGRDDSGLIPSGPWPSRRASGPGAGLLTVRFRRPCRDH